MELRKEIQHSRTEFRLIVFGVMSISFQNTRVVTRAPPTPPHPRQSGLSLWHDKAPSTKKHNKRAFE